MAQKTFTFTKKTIDMTDNPEMGANIIKVGKDKFTMRNYADLVGHDDSLPYIGTLCLNNVPLCDCANSGWGEETRLTFRECSGFDLDVIKDSLKRYKWKFRGDLFELELNFIADILAETCHLFSSKK